ncbi:hypothetical protein [Poseidonibacter antarcticus]|uniref:hypothetical protein n=1 Tax=Poseidonibacter antarcticus TaxID=2478538 RepID=UPI000EF55501|nr:hypothetical protein [Poseidonibacter antarcticus]
MRDDIKSKFISDIRLSPYKDFDEYKQNIKDSKEYYILLSIFEISLRNSIDNYFREKISKDWLSSEILHRDTKQRIIESKNKISQRKEKINHDKIIAELSFGFWTSLFRKSYSNLFRIKDIKNIFPNIPKKNEKFITRYELDKELNKIRKFRNRIFHYERIIHKQEYLNIKEDIYTLLTYFDDEICVFTKELINEPI